jgi:hypothetical protein
MKGMKWSGFWELVDRIREKAMTVRAIADVLSAVDAELEANTVRSLGVLLLMEVDGILSALKGLIGWARRSR